MHGDEVISSKSSLQCKVAVLKDAPAGAEQRCVRRGPRLHMRPPTLTERVVDCSGGEVISEESGLQRKLDQLVGLLAAEQRPRTVVFCNKIPTCRRVRPFSAVSSLCGWAPWSGLCLARVRGRLLQWASPEAPCGGSRRPTALPAAVSTGHPHEHLPAAGRDSLALPADREPLRPPAPP